MFDVWGFGWVWVGLDHGSIISPGSLSLVGLGWVSYLVGWAGSMKIDPWTTLMQTSNVSWRVFLAVSLVEK